MDKKRTQLPTISRNDSAEKSKRVVRVFRGSRDSSKIKGRPGHPQSTDNIRVEPGTVQKSCQSGEIGKADHFDSLRTSKQEQSKGFFLLKKRHNPEANIFKQIETPYCTPRFGASEQNHQIYPQQITTFDEKSVRAEAANPSMGDEQQRLLRKRKPPTIAFREINMKDLSEQASTKRYLPDISVSELEPTSLRRQAEIPITSTDYSSAKLKNAYSLSKSVDSRPSTSEDIGSPSRVFRIKNFQRRASPIYPETRSRGSSLSTSIRKSPLLDQKKIPAQETGQHRSLFFRHLVQTPLAFSLLDNLSNFQKVDFL